MSETPQSVCPSDGNDRVIDLSTAVLSRRDCALYIAEMSTQLSRMADLGALPEEIGFCLRTAARATQEWAGGHDRADPDSEYECDD